MNKVIVAAVLAACTAGTAQAEGWGYHGAHGPEHWGEVAKTCATGQNQSPVNIQSATEANLAPLKLSYPGMVTQLNNNGHTIQASVAGDNTLELDGQKFTLKQFHFHTPSENRLNDQQFPLEAHFVHANADGQLAVVSVMYKIGSQDPALSKLLKTLPANGQQVSVASLPVEQLLPNLDHYYRFNGSLTTPPCSEGVRWIVLPEAKSLTSAQQAELVDTMGHNNRPIQPHNARLILRNQ